MLYKKVLKSEESLATLGINLNNAIANTEYFTINSSIDN